MPNLPTAHTTDTGSDKHSTAYRDSKRRQDRRQFKTNSTTWRKIRAGQLAREPLCRTCAKQGITKAAKVVDHIDGDSFNNSEKNYQSLCEPCHNRKTALENGGFGR